MVTVGVRELKANLSRYLKMVRSGEKIIITDRKREVAVIAPCGIQADEEKVFQMIQRGLAQWSGGRPSGMPTRVVSKGKSVAEAVIEDRR